MNAEQRKLELAKKAMPHLVDPYGRGPAGLETADCATLLSMSPAKAALVLKGALAKLGSSLRSAGVTCVADLIPTRRPAPAGSFSGHVQ